MMNKEDIVIRALAEDIGSGDISAALIDDKEVSAKLVCLDNAIISGIDYFNLCFNLIDKQVEIAWQIKDGDRVLAKEDICFIKGSCKSIITAERVALNFLQMFSSTATKTRKMVDLIANSNTKILDTRKTIPNLRNGQKEAVLHGMGVNHRMGLYDSIMLKENHIFNINSFTDIITKANKMFPNKDIIVEVESLEQLAKVLQIKGIKRILCDNFTIKDLEVAVKMSAGIYPLEASGLINEDNILAYAKTGVNYISIGDLTKNIKAIDLSLIIY